MDPDEGEHDVMMAFLCHNEHNLMLMLYSGQVMFEIAASRLPIRLKAGMEEEDMRELRDVLSPDERLKSSSASPLAPGTSPLPSTAIESISPPLPQRQTALRELSATNKDCLTGADFFRLAFLDWCLGYRLSTWKRCLESQASRQAR